MLLSHCTGNIFRQVVRLTLVAMIGCSSIGDAIASQLPPQVKPLSLEECLEMATKNSIAVQTERNKLRAARLNFKNVEMDWLPDLLVGVSYKYQESNEEQQAGELFPYFALSQVIFNDERSYTAKLEAINKLLHAEEQLESSLRKLHADIITKYFSLLNAQSQLELEERFYNQSKTDYENARVRARNGLVSEIDLIKTESLFELAQAELDINRNRLEHAEFELSTLLNLDDEARIQASDRYSPVFYSHSFQTYRLYAEQHNPLLKLQRRLLNNLPEFRKLIKRTDWPTVSLSAYFGKGATEWDDENRYGLTINASKPLYDFGKTKRRQQILALELDTMEQSITETERHFFTNLQSIYKEFIIAGTIIQKSQHRIKLADRLAMATEKSYEMGIISQEQLLKNNNIRKEREKDYRSVVNKYLAAEMMLKLSCGVSETTVLLDQGPEWLDETASQGRNDHEMNHNNQQ